MMVFFFVVEQTRITPEMLKQRVADAKRRRAEAAGGVPFVAASSIPAQTEDGRGADVPRPTKKHKATKEHGRRRSSDDGLDQPPKGSRKPKSTHFIVDASGTIQQG